MCEHDINFIRKLLTIGFYGNKVSIRHWPAMQEGEPVVELLGRLEHPLPTCIQC